MDPQDLASHSSSSVNNTQGSAHRNRRTPGSTHHRNKAHVLVNQGVYRLSDPPSMARSSASGHRKSHKTSLSNSRRLVASPKIKEGQGILCEIWGRFHWLLI